MEDTPQPQPCWSTMLKTQPSQPQNPSQQHPQPLTQTINSQQGISMAVVDANAVIQGGDKLNHLADKFVTVPQVLTEIRDPVSRHRLSFVPFTIQAMEPTPESVNKVIKFARATGDLQTLSDVDLKLIALTYTLEAQIHGTNHLRDAPPPVHTVNVRRLPEKDLPGWGSNVPNLDEWEALENEAGDGSNSESRILPLKDISLNIIADDNQSENGSVEARGESHSENNIDEVNHGLGGHKKYPTKKREVKIEGKKMVAGGIDASQGSVDDDAGDWMPAVSRSTHRRYLRRKARREHYEALSEKDAEQELEKHENNDDVKDSGNLDEQMHQGCSEEDSGSGTYENGENDLRNGDDVALILNKMRLEVCSSEARQEGREENTASERTEFYNAQIAEASSEHNTEIVAESVDANAELEHFEVSSEANGSVDASFADGDDGEQSWMLRSLSESSVACVTSDFAMQNVLLQMGLRLVAPGGMQIRQLHRWILKCHACYTVTAEIGRIFCPKCGNGGTLRKVAVTVGENGIVLADRRPRISLRGTKFSLPLPKGGRDAIAKNVILREDQIPQKFLYPKTKKKSNKQGDDDFFCSDNIFIHHTDKRTPFQPPVKKAMALFSGKRNPNDNHYSRSKH